MKKSLIVVLLCWVASYGYGQIRFNVQGGMNLAGITQASDYSAQIGYRLGVGLEIPLKEYWSLQTGFQFTARRYHMNEMFKKLTVSDDGKEKSLALLSLKDQVNALYFQIPIKVAYSLPMWKRSALSFNGGVYLAYGIGGDTDAFIEYYESSNFQDGYIDINNPFLGHLDIHRTFNSSNKTFSNEGLKRFDMGISLGADYKYRNWFAGLGVEYGLLPVNKEFVKSVYSALMGDLSTVSPHNVGFELHVGYSFSL